MVVVVVGSGGGGSVVVVVDGGGGSVVVVGVAVDGGVVGAGGWATGAAPMGADVVVLGMAEVVVRVGSRAGAGGKLSTGSGLWAWAIRSRQMRAGIDPPVTRAWPATSRMAMLPSG